MVCLNHLKHLCNKDQPPANTTPKSPSKKPTALSKSQHQYTVLYRYTMEELFELYVKLKRRSEDYRKWSQRAKIILNTSCSDSQTTMDGIEIEEDDDIIEVIENLENENSN